MTSQYINIISPMEGIYLKMAGYPSTVTSLAIDQMVSTEVSA